MSMRLAAALMIAVPLLAACARGPALVETAAAPSPQITDKAAADTRCKVPAPAEKPGFTVIQVYFTCDDDLRPASPRAVPRSVPSTDATPQGALTELLKGPTATERAAGLSSVFSQKSAGMLNQVSTQNGRVVIELKNLSVSMTSPGTSAGTHQLLQEMGKTIAQFKAVAEIEYRVDGSCEAFWRWLQGECHVIPASNYR